MKVLSAKMVNGLRCLAKKILTGNVVNLFLDKFSVSKFTHVSTMKDHKFIFLHLLWLVE
jgi:hypothetical protein